MRAKSNLARMESGFTVEETPSSKGFFTISRRLSKDKVAAVELCQELSPAMTQDKHAEYTREAILKGKPHIASFPFYYNAVFRPLYQLHLNINNIDSQPPTQPSNLNAIPSTKQISLAWTPSTDNGHVIGYKIYRNSMHIANTQSTSYTDAGLTESTQYTYKISAYDNALNFHSKAFRKSFYKN